MEDATDNIETAPDLPTSSTNSNFWKMTTLILGVSTFGLSVLWYNTNEELKRWGHFKNFASGWVNNDEMFIMKWNATGQNALLEWDANFDGNFEMCSGYDFQGNKMVEYTDRNEDGYFEYAESFDVNGQLTYQTFDEDQNGFFERNIEHTDSLQIEYVDVNFDGSYDSVYVRTNDHQLLNALSWHERIAFYKSKKAE